MKIITHKDQPRETWRAGVETRMHIAAANGAAELCIFEQWVEPGTGAPTHSHSVEEVLTVIAGEAEMWIDDQRTVLAAGHSLDCPQAWLSQHRLRHAAHPSGARIADLRGKLRRSRGAGETLDALKRHLPNQ